MKKSVFGLLLFGCLTLLGLYTIINYIVDKEEYEYSQNLVVKEANEDNNLVFNHFKYLMNKTNEMIEHMSTSEDIGLLGNEISERIQMVRLKAYALLAPSNQQVQQEPNEIEIMADTNHYDIELIKDCNAVNYKQFLPEVTMNSKMKAALAINNPSISLKAKSALLINLDTDQVIYHKNAEQIIFPASTAKLLTALVVLDTCELSEAVTVGTEIKLIASDSSKAYLRQGYQMTIEQLLEAMLIPSGNDAAYALANYVGRKSLGIKEADTMEAIEEFVFLMNQMASELGLVNSCFRTPDGYDAIGQYTTAYDMALIGKAAYQNDIILKICNKESARAILLSGEDISWSTTNGLVKKDSPNYYSKAVGLKTGTSSMAGRCIITVGETKGKKYLAVVMNSTATGRFSDAKKLLSYVLD